jgi:hypothetical protein
MENSTPPEPLLHQIFSAQLEISQQNEQAITQGEIRGLADIDPITRDRLETRFRMPRNWISTSSRDYATPRHRTGVNDYN